MMREAIYKNLFRVLRNKVLSGDFDSKARFPSEGQLMRQFKVSRNTVRAALEELKRSGMIETKNGAGTFITTAAKRSTGYIGMIVPGISTGEIFPRTCTEFTRLARDAGYTTIFGDISSSDPVIRDTQSLRLAHDYVQQHIAGVLFEPLELTPSADKTTAEIINLLDAHHIPVVLIDRDIVPSPARSKYDLVGINNIRAGCSLCNHLISRGAKNIHVLVRPGSAPTVLDRARGVRDACLDAGLRWTKTHIHVADPTDINYIRQYILKQKADAIVCGNDFTAARLLDSLKKLGVDVPGTIKIAGVDDVHLASVVSPRLTTIKQPCEQLAQAAFSMLLQRIQTPDLSPREILLDADLVIRAST